MKQEIMFGEPVSDNGLPKGAAMEEACERIYQAYPRKVGKAAAKKAIERSLRHLSRRAALDPVAWLLDATRAFAASSAGNQGALTPHPATWYNRGSYDDDRREWGLGKAPEPEAVTERREQEHEGRVVEMISERQRAELDKARAARIPADLLTKCLHRASERAWPPGKVVPANWVDKPFWRTLVLEAYDTLRKTDG